MARKRKPIFLKPENALKEKVGEGGIPAFVIKRCQEYLESNPVDFTPYATKNLDSLKELYKHVEKSTLDEATAKGKITNIVMQLKSNGSMFHYQLISMISDVMLRYLANVTVLNQDFLEILGMFMRVLDVILTKRLTGNGGREGYALTQELHNACLRYYSKYSILE